jgi:hypothetical protein
LVFETLVLTPCDFFARAIAEDIGQNRGNVATRLLLELNPEVRGDCVDEKPDQILSQRPDFFKVAAKKLIKV